MNEKLDQEVQAAAEQKGLTYPKVRLDRINALMAMVLVSFHVVPGTTTTVATAILPMGHIQFTLATEISACIDPRNYSAEIGEQVARENVLTKARNELWKLEGYALALALVSAEGGAQ